MNAATTMGALYCIAVGVGTDDRVISTKRVGHVFVRFPVIFPALSVDQIAILIFVVRFEINRHTETIAALPFHWCGLLIPIVEIANQMNFLCSLGDCFRQFKRDFTFGL